MNFDLHEKKNQITLVVIVALLVAIILWLVYYFGTKDQLVNTQPAGNNNAQALPQTQTKPSGQGAGFSQDNLQRSQASRLAADFTERFGSYSNQNDSANLSELKLLATAKMQAKLESYRKSAANDTAVYQGVTTKALSTTFSAFSAEQASVVVSAQRQYLTQNAAPEIKYQDMKLSLIKKDGQWLVDEAAWQ
jgi:hypothetical protein